MPHYEYRCSSNGRTVEVSHGMNEHLDTWGELAGLTGHDLGDTSANAPVERIMSAPIPQTRSGGGQDFQGCAGACPCMPDA